MIDIPAPSINGTNRKEKKLKLDRLLEIREELTANKSKRITFSNPILRQDSNAVFYPRTINVIQGKAGVHKSRLAESICAALLKKPAHENDLLGFKADPFTSYSICYVDTERNLSDQLPYSLQQIQLKAGYEIEDEPENFDYISLLEFKREERFDLLNEYLEYVRQKFDTHIMIVLDVITDCIYNFNDTKDSLKLIDMMNNMINRYNVSFLCLIHENPGSTEKARGHLGTEIMNKASTVIQVGFEKDGNKKAMELIKVAYLKCRSSKKHESFYVQYSDSEKGLILADEEMITECLQNKNQKAILSDILEFLPVFLEEPLEKKKLITLLKDEFECKDRTVETRLKEIMELNTVIEDKKGNQYTFAKRFENRQVMCFLKPLE